MKKCPSCGNEVPITVCKSHAGYYLGRWCGNCGPLARLSEYYPTEQAALADLHVYKDLSKSPFWS